MRLPRATNAGAMLALAAASAFAAADPCAAQSSTSDVEFTLALKDHGPVFEYGEIIPLALSFRTQTPDRYSADLRNYDRSGRLGIEVYCVEPHAADPLESYFRNKRVYGRWPVLDPPTIRRAAHGRG